MKILILLFMLVSAFLAKNTVRAAQTEAAKPEEAGAPLKGFELKHVAAGSDLEKLGLKDGDILKSVNGQSISSQSDIDKLPEMLKTSKRVRIELTRNGKTEIFHRANFDQKK